MPSPTGRQSYTIATAAAVSGDGDYSGLDAADVTGTDDRRRRRGHHRRPGRRSHYEPGGRPGYTATFTVKLASEPTANVSVGLSFSYITAATVKSGDASPSPAANWHLEQTVTVTSASTMPSPTGRRATPSPPPRPSAVTATYSGAGRRRRDRAPTTDDDAAGIIVDPGLRADDERGGRPRPPPPSRSSSPPSPTANATRRLKLQAISPRPRSVRRRSLFTQPPTGIWSRR